MSTVTGGAWLRPLLLVPLIVLMSVSCGTTGRSPAELKDTPYGRMPPPRGTGLVSEWYVRTDWTPTGPVCAHLERTFATNDPVAFIGAFEAAGKAAAAQLDPSSLVVNGALDGDVQNSASAKVAGTRASLEFVDVDSKVGLRTVTWIDRSVWRYVAYLYVWDRPLSEGGKCGQAP